MTKADDLAQQYAALTPTVQAAVDELTELYGKMDELEQWAQLAADRGNEITRLNARIAELEAMLPPEFVRVLRPFGPDGGGGMNGITVDSLGGMWMPTDVGGVCHANPGEWFWHKCNTGLGGRRHIASLTAQPGGGMLLQGGAPGGQEGAFIFDITTHEWRGPLAGSTRGQVNSQNSDGWGLGIGHRYARSTGSLSFIRDKGDLVVGEFGYAPPGAGVCIVKPDGSAKTIPGTEQWAVRDLKDDGIGRAFVSIWKGGTKVASPGGLWNVDLATGELDQVLGGEVEESCGNVNDHVVAACRNDGIKRSFDMGVTWQDITYNLPRASWWYTVSINEAGDILAGCSPQEGQALIKGPDGKFWSWALLRAGTSVWVNLGALIDPTALAGDYIFRPPNVKNTLGAPGCTVTGVAWRGDVPVMSGGGGVCWAYIDGEARPASWGDGIIVVKEVDQSPAGKYAMAVSDFRAMTSADGIYWDKVNVSGDNEGTRVCYVGEVLHVELADGKHYKNGVQTTEAFPTKAPRPALLPEAEAYKDSPEVKRMGADAKFFTVDAATFVVFNHGAAIAVMERQA